MSVVFFSDREDFILFGVYEHLARRYECHYLMNDGKADILNPSVIITNHCINHRQGQKIIFYSTNPNGDDPKDRDNRRTMLGWLNHCEVVCASWAIAKMFYNTFRIKPAVQHPYIPEQKNNPTSIVYSTNFNNIEAVKNELQSEQFTPFQQPSDMTSAKIYLASSPLLLDLGLCAASSCGVPVVLERNNYLIEFLDSGDAIIDPHVSLNQKMQTIKKLLKEHDKVKSRSKRFTSTSTIEDKIKQALAKKPTTREILPLPKVNNSMSGVVRNRKPERHSPMLPLVTSLQDTTIYISGSIVGISGYDNLVYEITKGLKSLNIDVRINAANNVNYDICPKYFRDIHLNRPQEAWEIVIIPPCVIDRQSITKKSIIFTMWETDHLEPHWVQHMNNAAFIIVPSQWAVNSFKKSGITAPIHKIPLGYDPLVFNQDSSYPIECVFGTAAALTAGGLRKNTNYIVKLFQEAFPGNENVKLKIKITPSCPWADVKDERVEVTKSFLKPMDLANWYRSIGAFVNCSYAEGFGLHLIETMACGRTIISTKYSAVTEYFDESVGYVVDHAIVPASGGAYSGHWGKPNSESIIRWMRHIYSNRDEAMQKGEAAALRAKEYTWKNMGIKLINLLKENSIICSK